MNPRGWNPRTSGRVVQVDVTSAVLPGGGSTADARSYDLSGVRLKARSMPPTLVQWDHVGGGGREGAGRRRAVPSTPSRPADRELCSVRSPQGDQASIVCELVTRKPPKSLHIASPDCADGAESPGVHIFAPAMRRGEDGGGSEEGWKSFRETYGIQRDRNVRKKSDCPLGSDEAWLLIGELEEEEEEDAPPPRGHITTESSPPTLEYRYHRPCEAGWVGGGCARSASSSMASDLDTVRSGLSTIPSSPHSESVSFDSKGSRRSIGDSLQWFSGSANTSTHSSKQRSPPTRYTPVPNSLPYLRHTGVLQSYQ